MPDMEKINTNYLLKEIKRTIDESDSTAAFCLCQRWILKESFALLKEQEAKPPVHIHEEYPEHDWEREANGDIDDFAFEVDYHNGPMCKRCGYSFCIYCTPDGFNKKPCIIDKYKCPTCGRYICKGTKFCSNCGQELKLE